MPPNATPPSQYSTKRPSHSPGNLLPAPRLYQTPSRTYVKVRRVLPFDAGSLEALEAGHSLVQLELLLKGTGRPRQQLVEDVVAPLSFCLGHDPRLFQEIVLDLQQ